MAQIGKTATRDARSVRPGAAQMTQFLESLAESSNVAASARAAGVDPTPSPSPEGEGNIRFAGYAAVFDRVDRGGDVVRSGAFLASLAARRAVPLLWQHRPGAVVGVIETLAEDARGLRVVARVTHPTAAALVARGALTGLKERGFAPHSPGRVLLDL